MTTQSQIFLPTIGAIAVRNSVPTHRVLYAIRSLGIQDCQRAGNARVFTESQVKAIEEEMARIEKSRHLRLGNAV